MAWVLWALAIGFGLGAGAFYLVIVGARYLAIIITFARGVPQMNVLDAIIGLAFYLALAFFALSPALFWWVALAMRQ